MSLSRIVKGFRARPQLFLAILSFSIVCLFWDLAVRFGGLDEEVLPAPLTVANSFAQLAADGTLLQHSVASLFRVTLGFYLAALLGIPLGILIGRIQVVRQMVDPIIQFLRPISPLAWIPLAILWFGIGDRPAIFLIVLSSFFPLVLSTSVAVSTINPIYFQVATNFGFAKCEVLWKIIVPAIIPQVMTALRLSVAIAWLVVVAAEMIAVQSGLGYLILDARNALRMDHVMVAMLMIGLIGLLLDYGMRRLGQIESTLWKARC